jgi:hypothetical protein
MEVWRERLSGRAGAIRKRGGHKSRRRVKFDGGAFSGFFYKLVSLYADSETGHRAKAVI